MIYSSLILPLDYNNFKGLFTVNISKKINNLIVVLDVVRIKFTDDSVSETIMNTIHELIDSNPPDIKSVLNTVNTESIIYQEMNYGQVEKFYDVISNIFRKYQSGNDFSKYIPFSNKSSKIKIYIQVLYVRRLLRYLRSYLDNYQFFTDIIRYINTQISGKNKVQSDELFANYLNPSSQQSTDTNLNNNKNSDNSQDNRLDKTDSQTLVKDPDEITDSYFKDIVDFLVLDPQTIGYLIQLIMNYYIYYPDSSLIDESGNDKIIIKSLPIFPNIISINKTFILTLFDSLESTSLSKSNLIIKNVIKYLEKNKSIINHIHIKCLIYVLFIYSIRHILEINKNWIINNLDNIIYNVDIQNKILNTYISKIINTNIIIQLTSDLSNYHESIESESLINEISSKYKYLSNINQEEFANKVYEEYSNTPEKNITDDFNIGLHSVLDITKIIESNSDSDDNQLIEIKLPRTKNILLNYEYDQENNKIITKEFKYFLKYCTNPIAIKVMESNLIFKYFDVLKDKILNDTNIKKESINTYYYYKLLQKHLPNETPFYVYLLLIFKIIVPYMYYYYGSTIFEDTFLFTYKLN